jgi:hypothetical protein
LFRFERRGFFPDGSGAFLSQNIWLLALLTKVYVIQDLEATTVESSKFKFEFEIKIAQCLRARVFLFVSQEFLV